MDIETTLVETAETASENPKTVLVVAITAAATAAVVIGGRKLARRVLVKSIIKNLDQETPIDLSDKTPANAA